MSRSKYIVNLYNQQKYTMKQIATLATREFPLLNECRISDVTTALKRETERSTNPNRATNGEIKERIKRLEKPGLNGGTTLERPTGNSNGNMHMPSETMCNCGPMYHGQSALRTEKGLFEIKVCVHCGCYTATLGG